MSNNGSLTERFASLTNREREVGAKLVEGLTAKEIAKELGLSIKTVEAHKYNLYKKLDVHNKTALGRVFNGQAHLTLDGLCIHTKQQRELLLQLEGVEKSFLLALAEFEDGVLSHEDLANNLGWDISLVRAIEVKLMDDFDVRDARELVNLAVKLKFIEYKKAYPPEEMQDSDPESPERILGLG